MLIGSLLADSYDAPLITSTLFRSIFALLLFVFFLLYLFTAFKLKRIDVDKEYVYINNYKKTIRIKWEDIASLKTRSYGLFSTMRFYFKGKTSLGEKVSFLPSRKLVKSFMEDHPEYFPLMDDEQ